MRTSTTITALGIALAAATGAQAHIPPHHSAKAPRLTTTEQLELAQQQIAQLQAQLNAIQARLDRQTVAAPDPIMVAQANQAVATAQAANAKADTALAAATSAKVAIAKDDKLVSATKWAADTRISGRIFFNESTIVQNTAGGRNVATGTGFNIKRVYIGIDHKFDDIFAVNLTTDIANVTGSNATGNVYAAGTTPVGKGLFLKKAYLEAKLDPALWVRIGAADLPWISYIESRAGYRQIENMLIDRVNFGTTTDWGVHVGGDLFNQLISYQVSAIDGAGFRVVRVTRNIDIEARVSAQYKGLFAGIGGYTGKRGNGYQQTVAPLAGAPTTTFRTARRADAAVGFKNDQFTIGGEYFYAKNWNNVTVNPGPAVVNGIPVSQRSQDSAQGFTVFGNTQLTPKWSVFGRYDWVQPNRTNLPQVRDHYFNVGIQYTPVKTVDLALVYKREAVNNGAIGTQNGTIGCVTAATANSFGPATAPATCAGDGTYDEIGLFGQVRF